MHPLSIEQPDSLLTRASLLFRLRDWSDSTSWSEFYRLYRPMIYRLTRRSGLSHDEAEEVTQDVFKRVAETIHNFKSDPQRGSFRGWLMNLTRWRSADKLRARRPEEKRAWAGPARPDFKGTGTIERLPDPRNSAMAWESEWQLNLIDAALARLARRTPPRHFQVFELYTRQNWPVLRVAKELGTNPASIYLISHRLLKQLKIEVAHLKKQFG